MDVLFSQDDEMEALLAADFEIGHFIRERIVPRAVLYFTGEALETEDDVSVVMVTLVRIFKEKSICLFLY